MKMKISEKELKKNFKNIYSVRYCELKMLEFIEADYYITGVYGWNADAYKIDNNTLLVTGYRTFGKQVPKEIVNNYNKMFEELKEKYRYYGEFKEKLNILCRQKTMLEKKILKVWGGIVNEN